MANFRQIGTDFTNGLRAPHYVNGQLLTAEDLENDQQANLERIALAGRAAGMGSIDGFNVSAASDSRSLRVTAGLGINGKGDAVQLLADEALLPIQPVADEEFTIRRSGRFGECEGDDDNPDAPLTSGAYLLTVRPLARLEGSVPRQSVDGTETAACANQWEVEGVEFKIIRLINYQRPTESLSQRNRNLLAHWFYGSDALCNLMRDPFQFDQRYTGFSEIGASDFDGCDLPLAVFFWDDNRISFVDEWSVRRRIVHAYPGTQWKANLSDQREAEGEARFAQFQEELDSIRSRFGTNTSAQRAVTHFGYLPPVGFLPINPFELIYVGIFAETLTNSDELLSEIRQRELSVVDVFTRVRTSVLGTFENNNLFRLENFFDDLLPAEYQVVHEDLIHDRLHQSWVQPPISLPPPPAVVGGTVTPGFDFVTSVGEQVAVELSNPSTVFTGVFGTVGDVRLTQTIADRLTTISSRPIDPLIQPLPDIGIDSGIDSGINTGSGIGIGNDNRVDGGRVLNPSQAVAPASAATSQDQTAPLVELMVVDQLLEPYQALLANEMTDIIRGAITSLTTGGGVFTGINRFSTVTAEIRNTFTASAFVATASTVGVGRYTDLLRLVNQAKTPLFYVAFVRHRPEIVPRPLVLPDLDNLDG